MKDSAKVCKLDSEINVKLEKSVADCLNIMSEHMKITKHELVNTALKRFIATHKDYFPEKKLSPHK